MDAVTIVTAALTALTPYLAKGAEKFIQEMGSDAYEKTKNLFSTLKAKWAGEEKTAVALQNYEQAPQLYEPVIENLLKEKIENDPDLKTELTNQLQEMAPLMAPHIKVFQKVQNGENITGVEAEEIRRARIEVEQDLTNVKNATGVKAKVI